MFLSMELLAELFTSLPTVEAVIFKAQIHAAQFSVQETNQALSLLLSSQDLDKRVEKRDPVVQFNHYQTSPKQSLLLLAEQEKEYLNCFYYLQAGELYIASGENVDSDMLLYSELSPLQQLKAQQMFDQSCDEFELQSVSA